MKKIAIIIVASLFAGSAFSQEAPPKGVENTFNKMFKNAVEVNWDQEEATEWEAEFVMNGAEMTACFDNKGKWLETEKDVHLKDLPAEIFKSITLQFDEFEIKGVEGIENPDFKGYELALKNEDTLVDILATQDGTITIQKVVVIDEEEGDNEEHGNNEEGSENEEEGGGEEEGGNF